MRAARVIVAVFPVIIAICGCSGEDCTVAIVADGAAADEFATDELVAEERPTPHTDTVENAPATRAEHTSREELGTLSQAIQTPTYGQIDLVSDQ